MNYSGFIFNSELILRMLTDITLQKSEELRSHIKRLESDLRHLEQSKASNPISTFSHIFSVSWFYMISSKVKTPLNLETLKV